MEISFYDQWVKNGRDYSEAVAFYNQHGSNETLKRLFASGNTIYTRTKIAFELKAIGNVSAVQENVQVPLGFKTYIEPGKRIDPSTFPESLKSEFYKLGPLIGRIRFLHSRLDILQTDNERRVHALEILDSTDQRREIFNKIDYFIKHGKEIQMLQNSQPKAEVAIQETDQSSELKLFKLDEELRRLRVQRSKLKNQPNRQEKLNEVCARIEEIGKEISDVVI